MLHKKTRKIQLKLSESYFVISLLIKCTQVSCVNTKVAATRHSHETMGQRKCRKLLIKKSNCTKTVLKRNTIKQNDNAVVSGFFLKTNKSIFKTMFTDTHNIDR